jgi:hypothetical protein
MFSQNRPPERRRAIRRTASILMASTLAALTLSASADAAMNLPRPTFTTPAEGYGAVAPFQCAPALRPGTVAFANLVKQASAGRYSYQAARPCNATWGAKKSQHKTGRAVDIFIDQDTKNSPAPADGRALLDWLFENSAERLKRLGIVEIIWGGKIWTVARDGSRPSPNIATWRVYTGLGCPNSKSRTACHYDHFHFTLSREGSERRSSWWTAQHGAPQPPTPGTPPAPSVPEARFSGIAAASSQGYWLVERIGGVFSYGNAQFHGSLGGHALAGPTVAIAATPSRSGYWLAATDGGVFSFGDAPFKGSMGGKALNAPVVGITATPSGQGYWLTAADGGVFAFGDAGFFGSMGGQPLNKPVVGIASTPTGNGYWLVASDGGVFAFGDAAFKGSMGGQPLNSPVVGIAATASGQGYWLVAADGGMFAFGDAPFLGSMGGKPLASNVVGMAATPAGTGYWLVAGDGNVFAFGDAGSAASATAAPAPAAAHDEQAEAALGTDEADPAVAVLPDAFRAARTTTTVTYPAPRSGRVTITFQRARGGMCSTRSDCKFVRMAGQRSTRARAGENSYRFDGRVRGKALKPGAYKMVLALGSKGGARTVIGTDRFVIKR